MSKYKVDDQFYSDNPPKKENRILTVKSVFEQDGDTWYWVHKNYSDTYPIITYTESHLGQLPRYIPRFVEGKTYRHKVGVSSQSKDTWEILKVTEIGGEVYTWAFYRRSGMGEGEPVTMARNATPEHMEIV